MKIQCDCQGWKDRYGNLNYCSDCGKLLSIGEAEPSASDNTTKAEIQQIVKRRETAIKMGYFDSGLDEQLWAELSALC